MAIIKFKKINQEAKIPNYANLGDAGMDLYSIEDYTLKSKERRTFSLGIKSEFPSGFVALVKDKSGLASKHGIKTMAGVIDSTYRGEYKIVLLNTSNEDYVIKKGDKIAQLLLIPVINPEIKEVSELSSSERGEGGFGSSGR